jgi:M6 family metalloprotease-like protein
MKKALFIAALFLPLLMNAAPYNGNIMQFRQPDGSSVDVKLYGTEYYMRAEGLDGYTLVRDKSSGWICYAALSTDGFTLVSTGKKYNGTKEKDSYERVELNLPRHIDISAEARNNIISEKRHQMESGKPLSYEKTEPHLVLGAIKGLCIVVDFSDEAGTLPLSEFDNFCNKIDYTGFGNNGSLRTFYYDISGGLVDYQNIVYGYYRAPHTFAYYESLPMGQGAQQILGLTLNWIESLGFDFSTLSINPDGSIIAINLMYTGQAQTWAEGMWWHQGWYSGFSADGVHSGNYNCSPAYSPLAIYTVCHENGHMIGQWPDTYKYNNSTGPDGIGGFDLMCWSDDSYNPVPPNPHFWSNAGWGKLVDIDYFNGINSDTANTLTCYKYTNPNDTTEFFLLENRTKVGRSTAIPDEGLTIWHIDRKGNNQTLHHEVFLEHANNNLYDHTEACYHMGFVDQFDDKTIPGALFYTGDSSGLKVWNIGATGNIMTYKLGAGLPAPILRLVYNGISGDDNANGFMEPGESGQLALVAGNFGQVNSAVASITVSVAGSNSQYVTIDNPDINVDSLHVSESKEEYCIVHIAENIPVGSEIEFKFKLTDNTYSTYVTRKIIIGLQVSMDNMELTTCSAVFFDPGGSASNYSDMKDYTTTLFPASTGKRINVDFASFALEAETACRYDYLKIYDGPTVAWPLIGTYCGAKSPDVVTSTHESGALTFVFHSDEAVNDFGWKAVVSCVEPIAIADRVYSTEFEISPNPLTDISRITSNLLSSAGYDVTITDIYGKTVKKYVGLNQSGIELRRDEFEKGIYLVWFKDGAGAVYVRKLLVL